ncbi:MAG TPA: cyclopropane-fatty-acyl-phospholipid synthase family protein [Patescibacteria group bacterium]|jgi:cyclopropane-fatty-acyl-phospholipid synthase|nr:cyclopropane-fatty-acyl-phospholipid synthase family protein [Patescibacteria group bacterium]
MIAKAILEQVFTRAKFGSFAVDYWGELKKYGGNDKPIFTLTLYDPDVASAIVKQSDIGFGEAYMDKRLEVDNLDEFLKFTNLNNARLQEWLGKNMGYRFARNIRKKQDSQIQSHYDLGNDFYKLWLDSSMTYSCAYFKKPDDKLELAQQQKIDHVLGKLQLSKDQRLLDIGCGWGHLAIRAAKLYGVRSFGVTLSHNQYEYATSMAKREGVSNMVEFKYMNYQDIKNHKHKYDRIVSVGMFEHVGRNNQHKYFKTIDDLLIAGGLSVLHTITQQTEESMPGWIDKYIFPGGYVPSLREVVQLLPEYDLHLTDYESLRMHYAMTLDEWYRRFEANLDAVRKLEKKDERFIRMWRLYLRGSASSFRWGTFDLSQLVFTKGLKNDLPLTRSGLYLKPRP